MGKIIQAGSLCSGDEAEKITKFKDALGLGPEDAAAAHIDVGRRFLRLANEAGKASKGEYRKVLNSLYLGPFLCCGMSDKGFPQGSTSANLAMAIQKIHLECFQLRESLEKAIALVKGMTPLAYNR